MAVLILDFLKRLWGVISLKEDDERVMIDAEFWFYYALIISIVLSFAGVVICIVLFWVGAPKPVKRMCEILTFGRLQAAEPRRRERSEDLLGKC